MSFVVSQETPPSVHLTHAILIYGAGSPGAPEGAEYATVHQVATEQDAPVIQPGVPVDQRALMAFATALAGRQKLGHGLLPAHVLSVGLNHVVWWTPAGARNVFFNTQAGERLVGVRSGQVPLPALVFTAIGRLLYVFAVKGKNRPDSGTPLYHAPCMNVWDSGQVCTGSTPLPGETVVDTIQAWTDGFWGSNFTHTNHENSVKFEGGCHALWNALLDGRFGSFPTRALVRRKKETVGQWIQRVEVKGIGNAV